MAIKNNIDSHIILQGDSIEILNQLSSQYCNKVNLIYIDPPFGTNKSYYQYSESIKNNLLSINKELAYNDYWSVSKFKSFIQGIIKPCSVLLSENGFLVFQCDSNFNYIVRMVLNNSFGEENFKGEIIINVESRDLDPDISIDNGKIRQCHNSLFIYTKNVKTELPLLLTPKIVKRASMWFSLSTLKKNENRFTLLGITPKNCYWRWEKERALQAVANYNSFLNKKKEELFEEYAKNNLDKEFIKKENNVIKYYYNNANDYTEVNSSYWFDISYRGYDTNYPTEKSLPLLNRIISWLTFKNSIVLDPFLGSGTTLISCESLNRCCIGIDINKNSILTATKRLKKFKDNI